MTRHVSSARRVVASLALPALLLACLTACDNESDSNAPNATESTTDVETSSDTAGTTATSSEPTGSTDSSSTEPPQTTDTTGQNSPPPSHDNSSPRRAKDSQVTKADMAGFNDQWTWDRTRGTNAPPSGPAVSRCSRGSLTAIGGVAEYSTTYLSNASKNDQALLTVAVFPDEKTATMAESVLKNWLAGCRSYLAQKPGVDRVKVTADTPVTTSVGTGHERVVSYGPVPGDPDSTYFNGEGYVRDGDVISFLVFHSVGQDYNYEQGQEPVALGLQAAADALKASR